MNKLQKYIGLKTSDEQRDQVLYPREPAGWTPSFSELQSNMLILRICLLPCTEKILCAGRIHVPLG